MISSCAMQERSGSGLVEKVKVRCEAPPALRDLRSPTLGSYRYHPDLSVIGTSGRAGSWYSDSFGPFSPCTCMPWFFIHTWHQCLICHFKEVSPTTYLVVARPICAVRTSNACNICHGPRSTVTTELLRVSAGDLRPHASATRFYFSTLEVVAHDAFF